MPVQQRDNVLSEWDVVGYVFFFVLAVLVVIVILALLGPAVGNIFTDTLAGAI
jgi:hypothetical protein